MHGCNLSHMMKYVILNVVDVGNKEIKQPVWMREKKSNATLV